jgi:hypothetical protein
MEKMRRAGFFFSVFVFVVLEWNTAAAHFPDVSPLLENPTLSACIPRDKNIFCEMHHKFSFVASRSRRRFAYYNAARYCGAILRAIQF